MTMAKGPPYGEEVRVPGWLEEVRGRVREVYGTPPRVYVVVELTPALSGSVVDAPTTVVVPLDALCRRPAART